NADIAEALRADLLLDYFTVHLNGPRANGKKIILNWNFTDSGAKYMLSLENSAITYVGNRQAPDADATVNVSQSTLISMALGRSSVVSNLASGQIVIQGDVRKLIEFLSLMDNFDLWFNLVTPNK